MLHLNYRVLRLGNLITCDQNAWMSCILKYMFKRENYNFLDCKNRGKKLFLKKTPVFHLSSCYRLTVCYRTVCYQIYQPNKSTLSKSGRQLTIYILWSQMGNISKPHSAELDGRCWLVSWLPCKITVTTKGLTFPRRQESEKKQLIEGKISSTNCWVRTTWKSERKQTSPEIGNWRILCGNWWFSMRANTSITRGNWHFQVAGDYCLFHFYRFLFVGGWSSPRGMRLSGGQFPNLLRWFFCYPLRSRFQIRWSSWLVWFSLPCIGIFM